MKFFKENRKAIKKLDLFAAPASFRMGKGNVEDGTDRIEQGYATYFGAFCYSILFTLCAAYFI